MIYRRLNIIENESDVLESDRLLLFCLTKKVNKKVKKKIYYLPAWLITPVFFSACPRVC